MEIQSAIQGLAGIRAIASGLVAFRDEAKVIELKVSLLQQVFDIQQDLLALQQENATLLKENRDLKEQAVKAKKMDAERESHELFEVAPSVYAYAPKSVDGARPIQPYYCQRCYEDGESSVLGFKAARSTTKGPEPALLQCPEKAAHQWQLPRGWNQHTVATG